MYFFCCKFHDSKRSIQTNVKFALAFKIMTFVKTSFDYLCLTKEFASDIQIFNRRFRNLLITMKEAMHNDQKKTILITGVSTGIGHDLAVHLLENNHVVIGTVRNEVDGEELKNKYDQNFHSCVYDVTDIDGLQGLVKKVETILNGNALYALVNNAGLAMPGPLEVLPYEDFKYQMEVNVMAVFRITNAFLAFLGTAEKYRSTPGRIINISSVSGLFNSPLNGAYAISKHALESMTEIYRREVGLFGIKVCAIEPGPIQTKIWSKNTGALSKFINTHYGKYVGHADKIIERSVANALPTSAVIDVVQDALFSNKPRHQYLVHKNKFKFYVVTKFLPSWYVDRMIFKSIANFGNNRPF